MAGWDNLPMRVFSFPPLDSVWIGIEGGEGGKGGGLLGDVGDVGQGHTCILIAFILFLPPFSNALFFDPCVCLVFLFSFYDTPLMLFFPLPSLHLLPSFSFQLSPS